MTQDDKRESNGKLEMVVELCPKCGAEDCSDQHHQSSFAVPECFYKECHICGHQWGHE